MRDSCIEHILYVCGDQFDRIDRRLARYEDHCSYNCQYLRTAGWQRTYRKAYLSGS